MSSGGNGSSVGDYGYNKAKVEELREEINSAASNAADFIVEAIETEIVDKVATAWYSEVAVDYFGTFKATVDGMAENIHRVFQDFADRIQSAGSNWAERTGGEAPELAPIDDVTMDLNVEPIQATNDEGDRFITESLSTNIEIYVSDARSSIKYYISQQVSMADVGFAFLGGGQGEAISEAAGRLDDLVDEVLNSLVEGDNSIVTAINNFKNQYVETASDNAQLFTDSNLPD